MVVLMIWMIAGRVIVIMVVMGVVVMVVCTVVTMTLFAARSMIVIVTMAVVGLRSAAVSLHISPAFGIERRLERDRAGAETLDHRFDNGIAADAERLCQNFGR